MAVQNNNIVISPPDTLLSCIAQPDIPDPDKASQREVAAYLPALYEWGSDCESTLRAVKDFISKEKTRINGEKK